MAPPAGPALALNDYINASPTSAQQWHILAQYFTNARRSEIFAASDTLIVGIDAEWNGEERTGGQSITELGIAIIDPRKSTPRAGLWGVLDKMSVYHIRIRENAHLELNGVQGHPMNFEFGYTRYLTMNEASQALFRSFVQPKLNGTPRPVIFVGHALDNDTKMLKRHFNIDLENLGVIAKTVDTQELAREAKLVPQHVSIGLQALLKRFGIDEWYLHNAGNDIAASLVAAFMVTGLMVAALEPSSAAEWSARGYSQLNYDNLKEIGRRAQAQYPLPYGVATFCTRCDSTGHFDRNCTVAVHCNDCAKSRPGSTHTHKTDKCTFLTPVAVPCEYCITARNAGRNRQAEYHETKNCKIGPE